MNNKEIRELNERLARFEFGEDFIGIGKEYGGHIRVNNHDPEGIEFVKPLYTNSIDSCLPLLEKLKPLKTEVYYKGNSDGLEVKVRLIFNNYKCSFVEAKSKEAATALAIAIDKAINELSKSEGG